MPTIQNQVKGTASASGKKVRPPLAVLANVGGAKLAMMLLLLGLPILDTARVIVRRLRAGRSPLHPDRSHLHYRLLAGGLTQRRTALLFYAVTAAFGVVTLLGAYLQTRPTERRLEIAGLPWLSVAFSELPTLLGMAAVAAVSLAIWRIAAARRRKVDLPPGASYPSLPGRTSRPS